MSNTDSDEWISMNEAAMRHGCDRAMIRKRIAVGMLESRPGISPHGGSAPTLVRAADVGPALAQSARKKAPPVADPAKPAPPQPPDGWAAIGTASEILHVDPRAIRDRVAYGLLEAQDFTAGRSTWKIVNVDAARVAMKTSIRPRRFMASQARNYALAEQLITMLDADEGNLTACCIAVGFTVSNITNWTVGDCATDASREIGARVRAASERQQQRERDARHAEMRAFIEVAKGCTTISEAARKAGISRDKVTGFRYTGERDAPWYDKELHDALHGHAKSSTRPSGNQKMAIGRVYVIGPTDGGDVKIGFTAYSADNRLRDIQTGHPKALSLLAVGMGTRRTEKQLHAIFAAYRQNGEWFTAAPPIRAMIRVLASRGPAEPIDDDVLSDIRRAVEHHQRAAPAPGSLFDAR